VHTHIHNLRSNRLHACANEIKCRLLTMAVMARNQEHRPRGGQGKPQCWDGRGARCGVLWRVLGAAVRMHRSAGRLVCDAL
jgi:hypothetical protein